MSNKLEDRLLLKMLEIDGCWVWQEGRNQDGYGQTSVAGVQILVHRLMYELHVGAIPRGFHVLHSCDNPPCANPAHLKIGTNHENIIDAFNKGRRLTRLLPTDIPTIRTRLARGELQKDIARDYGVTQMTISLIARGKLWRGLLRKAFFGLIRAFAHTPMRRANHNSLALAAMNGCQRESAKHVDKMHFRCHC